MMLVFVYSVFLVLGIIASQAMNLTTAYEFLRVLTNVCLAYIMMEVGVEFALDKTRLKSYGLDFIYAFLAAALPWIFCAVYFIVLLKSTWQEAFLVGVFAAPTSAGILFAMLAAAGLGATWLFRKAEVLAVFDDFVAILLLIPFQIIFIGFKPQLFFVVFFMAVFLGAAFHFLHKVRISVERPWLLFYGAMIVVVEYILFQEAKIDIGVLLPSFAFGAMLYNPHLRRKTDPNYDKTHQEPVKKKILMMDRFIKSFFMFLVGCSLPKIQGSGISGVLFVEHILAITILLNLGKSFLFFCYQKEASWRNRLALSIAMFPRGEVGAGVLLVAMGYGIGGLAVSLSILSLAFNLVLTGIFIMISMALVRKER